MPRALALYPRFNNFIFLLDFFYCRAAQKRSGAVRSVSGIIHDAKHLDCDYQSFYRYVVLFMERCVARIKLSDHDFVAIKTVAIQDGLKLYEVLDKALLSTSMDMPLTALRPRGDVSYKTLYHTSPDNVLHIAEQLDCNQSNAIYTAIHHFLNSNTAA